SPPPLDLVDKRFPGNQPRYSGIVQNELPLAESMQQAHLRMLSYWQGTIVPEIQSGKRILIVSHKNILRTLMMQLEGISNLQVMKLSIATGRPLVYDLNNKLRTVQRYYVDFQHDR
ncbi:MAG: 2,3-bisphosphoglycerate-dependent phosphoglycerate mutase, partial [Proteobacteria bacterium]|nr:2,3-bisphosphoglycerate-dependent phosphoglycerate mutase [Pseudomonadota bacterium]